MGKARFERNKPHVNIGTIGHVLRYVASPEGRNHLICRGEQRFRLVEFLPGYPFLVARVEAIPETPATGTEVEARTMKLKVTQTAKPV